MKKIEESGCGTWSREESQGGTGWDTKKRRGRMGHREEEREGGTRRRLERVGYGSEEREWDIEKKR